jgi:hypothetical protein
VTERSASWMLFSSFSYRSLFLPVVALRNAFFAVPGEIYLPQP